MVMGYHTDQSVWTAVVGEELPCQRETVNPRDPFVVAVLKDEVIVGHIPRKSLDPGAILWLEVAMQCHSFVRAYKSIVT